MEHLDPKNWRYLKLKVLLKLRISGDNFASLLRDLIYGANILDQHKLVYCLHPEYWVYLACDVTWSPGANIGANNSETQRKRLNMVAS